MTPPDSERRAEDLMPFPERDGAGPPSPVGSPAPASPALMPGEGEPAGGFAGGGGVVGTRPLRVLSWNVHGCVGVDRRLDPVRVAQLIRTIDPDVAGLQEVDLCHRDAHGRDALEVIAEETGLAGVHGPTMQRPKGDYGNAVLSRWPIAAALPLDFSVPGREPRGAMDVTVVCPGGSVRVVVTHLGLGRRERRRQVDRLLHRLDRPLAGTSGADDRHPLILMGDFNEWLPWGRTALTGLKSAFAESWNRRTFPSVLPVLSLDRILVRPAPPAGGRRRPAPRGCWKASDHLPLIADLRF